MLEADRVHSTPPENTSPLSPHSPPLTAPGDGLGGLYVPTDVAPEVLFQAIGRLRREAQDEIERLLSFLDETERDCDLEPSLGFPELGRVVLDAGHPGAADDREDEADEEIDRVDDEPSLGAREHVGFYVDQTKWAHGDRTDLEESLGDDEPSLGWTTSGSVGMPFHPGQVDVEDEHDGAEPDVCGEPNLGSFDRMLNQEKSWQQRPAWVQDGEVDVLDAGIADGPRQATESRTDA